MDPEHPQPLISENAAELTSGARLGSYLIEGFEGRGGMGVVYRARDEKLQRKVAIKVLAPGILHDNTARRRLLTEARALAQLSHPNILAVYDVDRSDNLDFIAMEWVDGRRLDQVIGRRGLPVRTALSYAVQIADALARAHAKGIVHRDLKPSNVMITSAGAVKVLDFGLAKIASLPGGDDSTGDTSHMGRGRIVGTVAYMSPEQAQGDRLDHRSDVFSFGSVLYEMLSGHRAFRGESVISTIASIIKEDPIPLGARVPRQLRRIVERCLQKSPERRYQAISDVKLEIEEAVLARFANWTVRSVLTRLAVPALLAAAAVVAGFMIWRFLAARPPLEYTMEQVTVGPYWNGQPELSPDGSRFAFASSAAGNSDIYVADIHGNGQQRITDDRAEDTNPTWFPDGSAIVFCSNRNGRAGIWKTGPQGGAASMLVADAVDPAISPDQSRIAFMTVAPDEAIAVAPLADPSHYRLLTSALTSAIAGNPSWSPDNRSICYVDRQELWIVDTEGGPPRQLTFDGQYKQDPVWAPDGRRIYFSSVLGGSQTIWRIGSDGGSPSRVIAGTSQEVHPSVSRDGRLFACATDSTQRAIELVDTGTGTRNLIPGNDWYMPSLSRDGTRAVFISMRPGTDSNLYVQELGNGKPAGAPTLIGGIGGVLSHPAISPDGNWIACYRIQGGKRDILVVSSAGGPATQITSETQQNVHPAWAPDGSALVYAAKSISGSELWIVPMSDGRPAGPFRKVVSTAEVAYAPAWSADASTIAYVEFHGDDGEVKLVPADGSAPPRQVTIDAHARRVRWDTGGDLLVSGTWGGEKIVLRRIRLRGTAGPAEPAIELGGLRSAGLFDITGDGRLIALSREDASGQVWILRATNGVF